MIRGNLYEDNSSTSNEAELYIEDDNYILKKTNNIVEQGKLSNLLIGQRIGNVNRQIKLESNKVFITNKNDLVDLYILKYIKKNNLLHKLESNFIFVLLSIVITILISFSFLKWGIPYSSKKLANAFPLELTAIISKNTLKYLDQYLFKESKIDASVKDKVLLSFQNEVLPYIKDKEEFVFKLHFREWKMGKENIANAFALPDGTIIVSDEFVRLSENIMEINSVLFHEIAHVKKRHGLQKITEGTFLTVLMMYISDDSTIVSDFGIGLSPVLVDSYYSRTHEQEADNYALDKMLKANINPKYFSNILNRIGENTESKEESIINYLDSHPSNQDRIKIANKYENCFKKKLLICK